MKVTLHSTETIVQLDTADGRSMPARLWRGETDKGVEVIAFVTRIAAAIDADLVEFDKELQRHDPPPDHAAQWVESWPARLLID